MPKAPWSPPDQGTQVMSVDEYARNLEQIVKRLKQTRAKLIFATTTPVPDGAAGRIKGDVERYNRAALAIMKRHGVRVNDLYAFALPRLALHPAAAATSTSPRKAPACWPNRWPTASSPPCPSSMGVECP